jgi:hypothetical protein
MFKTFKISPFFSQIEHQKNIKSLKVHHRLEERKGVLKTVDVCLLLEKLIKISPGKKPGEESML